ncbi:UNVERIFIED_CONTAM: Polygalacturonase [Sesamum radiatum]|uniref:Polygalacturonase n=1 Tax=Sesamum radiatum TaxID=300843 RepID=A0AAW2JS82_SESRA
MGGFCFKNLTFMIVILLIVWCSHIETCNARRVGRHWRQSRGGAASLFKKKGKKYGSNHHNGNAGKPKQKTPSPKAPAPVPPPAAGPKQSPPPPKKGDGKAAYPTVLSVLDFGAKGDGSTDDTKAFQAAWAAACKVEASVIDVPAKHVFLVGPISFSGPYCQHDIVFQLDGKIVAPTGSSHWGSGLLQWLEFTKLVGLTIKGSGTIDGNGAVWWQSAPYDDDPLDDQAKLIFHQMARKKLTWWENAKHKTNLYNFSVSSPGDSPNTDGIHLQNSKDVLIRSSNLACGDDCVSIQTGCTNVYIHNVNCGPGHGISIGGLGKDNTKACVSNITVRDIIMHNTMNGVRIKTWQGGSGSVQGVQFSNIQMSEVQLPIVIDQYYCDKTKCKNQTSAVALSEINYENIRGTYTIKPVHFACSDSLPCTDVTLTNIQLKPQQELYHMYDPFCWQTFGKLYSPMIPPSGV